MWCVQVCVAVWRVPLLLLYGADIMVQYNCCVVAQTLLSFTQNARKVTSTGGGGAGLSPFSYEQLERLVISFSRGESVSSEASSSSSSAGIPFTVSPDGTRLTFTSGLSASLRREVHDICDEVMANSGAAAGLLSHDSVGKGVHRRVVLVRKCQLSQQGKQQEFFVCEPKTCYRSRKVCTGYGEIWTSSV